MNIDNLIDTKELLSSVANVAVLVIVLLFTTFSKKVKSWLEKKTNEKFVKSIDKSPIVRDQLTEVRALMDADRALLFQLHNGQYYFSGEGADKLSLSHFVADAGVALPDRAGTRLQNIPISYWPETFKIMQTRGFFLEQTDGFVDPFNAQMFAVDGVESVVCGPVKDRKGHWKGVLIIEFMQKRKEVDLTIATEYGQRIGDLLSL